MGEGLCIGLPSISARHPTPTLDGADNGLTAGMDVDVLDRDLLLTFTPVPVQGLDKRDIGPRQLVGLGEALAPRSR
jgi:hypothetical protein